MTPCEEKGYEVGQVFKRTADYPKSALIDIGDLLVLSRDDGSNAPEFTILNGRFEGNLKYCYFQNVTRIYPPEEVKEPVETITLMGREYNKQEIEAALADVLPVGE